MPDELASLHAFVYGRVQGTYFRAFVRRHAEDLGLTGYVRNMPDGTVEVLAEGETKLLERLIAYLHVGPPAAKVEKVITRFSETSGGFSGFTIKY